MLSAVLDFVYPLACAGCGTRGCSLCATCLPAPRSNMPFERAGVAIVAIGPYGGTWRRAVLALKHGRRDVVAPLAGALADVLDRYAVPPDAAIVPVPTTSRRAADRGFDQGLALAHALAESGRPVIAALRKRAAGGQRGRSRAERLAASGRYAVVLPELTRDASFVLIDDVVTTGATLADCAATLVRAGARVRGAFVLAHA